MRKCKLVFNSQKFIKELKIDESRKICKINNEFINADIKKYLDIIESIIINKAPVEKFKSMVIDGPSVSLLFQKNKDQIIEVNYNNSNHIQQIKQLYSILEEICDKQRDR